MQKCKVNKKAQLDGVCNIKTNTGKHASKQLTLNMLN